MKHLHLFEKYSHYDEARDLPNFVGYHCSKGIITDFDGTVKDDASSIFNTYGKDWYARLLEELGWHEQLRTMPEGVSEGHPKLERWYDMVGRMLARRNIHWIFVARDMPHTQYGEYQYAVSIDSGKVLFTMDDTNEIDSDIYVYNSKKVKPTLVPLFDMPEPKAKVSSGAFVLDRDAEGLGLFQRSPLYKFPWEVSESEYSDDMRYPKGDAPYPYHASVASEKLIYELLGIKPFSIGSHETFCRFREYMDSLD